MRWRLRKCLGECSDVRSRGGGGGWLVMRDGQEAGSTGPGRGGEGSACIILLPLAKAADVNYMSSAEK